MQMWGSLLWSVFHSEYSRVLVLGAEHRFRVIFMQSLLGTRNPLTIRCPASPEAAKAAEAAGCFVCWALFTEALCNCYLFPLQTSSSNMTMLRFSLTSTPVARRGTRFWNRSNQNHRLKGNWGSSAHRRKKSRFSWSWRPLNQARTSSSLWTLPYLRAPIRREPSINMSDQT